MTFNPSQSDGDGHLCNRIVSLSSGVLSLVIVVACASEPIPQGGGVYKVIGPPRGAGFLTRWEARGAAESFCEDQGKVMSIVDEMTVSDPFSAKAYVWFRCEEP